MANETVNLKYGQNTLQVFITGLRCSSCVIPSTLALAQELDTNHVGYNFVTTYCNNLKRNSAPPQ